MEADFTHGLLNAPHHMGVINGSLGTSGTQINDTRKAALSMQFALSHVSELRLELQAF